MPSPNLGISPKHNAGKSDMELKPLWPRSCTGLRRQVDLIAGARLDESHVGPVVLIGTRTQICMWQKVSVSASERKCKKTFNSPNF